MKYSKLCTVFSYIILSLLSLALTAESRNHKDFFHCLLAGYSNFKPVSDNLIYTPNEPAYPSVLNASIQNPKFSYPSILKPLAIITPDKISHVQSTVYCARKYGIHIRSRSGGHDFEGLSYVSNVSFIVIDLFRLRSIKIDVQRRSAWVHAGATIGELYYRIAEKSETLGFPAGFCPTVGVGGHFSGGGYGIMMRKYGLAADNILDAHIVDAEGKILDREFMGEDLFWAIRGGGAASFGVVVAWKVKLVQVPQKLTLFSIPRDLEIEENKKLVQQWQHVANELDENLLLFTQLTTANSTREANKTTIQAWFTSLYLGELDDLIPLMQKGFPELGLVRENCIEVSWIRALTYLAGFPGEAPLEVLLQRTPRVTLYPFKAKLDYVKKPLPQHALEGMWEKLSEVEEVGMASIVMYPYGGVMDKISKSEIPFPHRAGNLFSLLYYGSWEEGSAKDMNWARRVYDYMTPYVSDNPRSAYVNYRDLDLGTNNEEGPTTVAQASIWGTKYFGYENFNRLVQVKTVTDPTNFFRNEQSIPVYA